MDRRSTLDLPDCAQRGCWNKATGSCGFCTACYAAWRNLLMLNPRDSREYLQKRERIFLRAQDRAGMHIRPRPGLTVGQVMDHGSVRLAPASRKSRRTAT